MKLIKGVYKYANVYHFKSGVNSIPLIQYLNEEQCNRNVHLKL